VQVGGSVSYHVKRQGMECPLAVAAFIAVLLLSGCAADNGFPAVHDMPAARTETTLTPDEVKQATDSLISQRDHLSAGAQGNAQPVQAASAPAASAPQQKPAAATAAAQPAATDDSTGATAIGAYAKP
jgi:hypothetical protein